MIFFMSPSSPLSNLGRPEIHLREAERIQQPVRRLAPSTCKHQTKGIPESRSSMRRADRSRRANPMLGAAKSADARMAGVSQSARGETTRRIATIAWRISAGVALAYSSATRPGGSRNECEGPAGLARRGFRITAVALRAAPRPPAYRLWGTDQRASGELACSRLNRKAPSELPIAIGIHKTGIANIQ